MAIPWLLALKVIPWGDVIEHAPTVLKAARKLLDRQKAEQVPGNTPASAVTELIEPVPSLGEIKNRLMAAQVQLNQQADMQSQLSQTLAELAEQNARLVGAVEVLRVRTRLLLWAVAALALGLAWVVWR